VVHHRPILATRAFFADVALLGGEKICTKPPHRGARRQEGQQGEHRRLEGEVAPWRVAESMTLPTGDASPSRRPDHVRVAPIGDASARGSGR